MSLTDLVKGAKKLGRSLLFNSLLTCSLFFGCSEEKIVYKEQEGDNHQKQIVLDLILSDRTNPKKYGVENWIIRQYYDRFYYNRGTIEVDKKTDKDGYARFEIPWDDRDEGVNTYFELIEIPQGEPWIYLQSSPNWTFREGEHKYVWVAIYPENRVSWSLANR